MQDSPSRQPYPPTISTRLAPSAALCLSLGGAITAAAQGQRPTRPDTFVTAARAPRVEYTPDSSIAGYNAITYRVLTAPPAATHDMQIDLMEPLEVDSMVQDGKHVRYRREGAAFFASLTASQTLGAKKTIAVYYHGKPRIARNPPWQGGFTGRLTASAVLGS